MNKKYPTRKAQVYTTDNGTPYAYSMTSHTNVKVNAEVQPPLQLPGLIIFVHGVNSEGEWYDKAEKALCEGLNERLGLLSDGGKHKLRENTYLSPHWNKDQTEWIVPPRRIKEEGRSPVIRFYWGYRAADEEAGEYAIPLKNAEGENFYDLTPAARKDKEQVKAHGPWFWGGGPFQNGCNQLVSLWSSQGFTRWIHPLGIPLPFSTQLLNGERDRLLSSAPPRHYYAHAAGRLAGLIRTIRQKHPEDTVTVLSHSQGTMIALAAAAMEAPDALFLMNSPYALTNVTANYITYPMSEIISAEAREATFADIVKKVAENKRRLASQDTGHLLAGVCSDGESWMPQGKTHRGIPERDNHGTTWIYCNPHDRVMGASPLRSIGWQGLPNTPESNYTAPHPLFREAGGTLYVRMLARGTPCGGPPDSQTHFSELPDGEPFWERTTTVLQKLTWPEPAPGQKLTINAPAVPEPLTAKELEKFDEDYASLEKQSGETGYGYGQIDIDTVNNGDPSTRRPVDPDYRYYISLYGYFDRKMVPKQPSTWYQPGPGSKEGRVKFEKQSREEMLEEIRTYVVRPTDHSTLPSSQEFMRRVVAYDLPVGYCWHAWDRESLAALRRQADWLESDDYYLYGRLDIPAMPDVIRTDVEKDAEKKKAEAYAYYSNKKENG